jgi:hypothetical protein
MFKTKESIVNRFINETAVDSVIMIGSIGSNSGKWRIIELKYRHYAD